MIYFLFFLGLFIGSFLGVLVDRLSRSETVIKGHSHCEFCKKNLKWSDLIPLLSFIFLKGKCRYCHKRLSIYYPIIEASTGAVFVLTYFLLIKNSEFIIHNSQFTISYLSYVAYYLAIASSLIVVFFSDLKYGIIPDKVLVPAIVLVLIYSAVNYQLATVNYFISGIITFLFFLSLFLLTKGRGMGFGDVKFAFLMGLLLGFPNIIVALYIAFLTAAALSIILILWRGKHFLKRTIPFGPFLALATFISLVWGNIIWQKVIFLLF